MSFIYPALLKKELPLSARARDFISSARAQAAAIMEHRDHRLVCIVGPCSIHDPASAIEYAERLQRLKRAIDHSIFLVMRCYCEKSRTNGGWKGLISDPGLDGSCDIARGLYITRRLLLDLAERQIPAAAEFLDPLAAPYYDDLITWGFIGARTASSHPHRQLASSFDFPVGFKNNIYGELDASIYGAASAQKPQTFLSINDAGHIATLTSRGNPWTHIVLRGSVLEPNFNEGSVKQAIGHLQKNHLESHLMIDCSHGNSGKDHRRQEQVFQSILNQIQSHAPIIGIMLESHLNEGRQALLDDPVQLGYGISITDSCVGWEETEEMLLSAASLLSPTSISWVQK
ncbi:MAG: aroF [Parachlamydiales bacterium]|nr:aroF [Parachlamydiales bacterium]